MDIYWTEHSEVLSLRTAGQNIAVRSRLVNSEAWDIWFRLLSSLLHGYSKQAEAEHNTGHGPYSVGVTCCGGCTPCGFPRSLLHSALSHNTSTASHSPLMLPLDWQDPRLPTADTHTAWTYYPLLATCENSHTARGRLGEGLGGYRHPKNHLSPLVAPPSVVPVQASYPLPGPRSPIPCNWTCPAPTHGGTTLLAWSVFYLFLGMERKKTSKQT